MGGNPVTGYDPLGLDDWAHDPNLNIRIPQGWDPDPGLTPVCVECLVIAPLRVAKTIYDICKQPELRYDDRVRKRGVEDPVSHNFPYRFDKEILSTKPIPKNNGYTMFQKPGSMTGRSGTDKVTGARFQTYKDGVFEIGVRKDGIIDHRFFRPNQ